MRPFCALAGCGLIGLLVGSIFAQTGTQETSRVQTETTTTTQVIRISQVLGSAVALQDGVSYGKVTDFVLTDAGCIDYLVVGYEDSFVVVPWTFATVDFEQRVVRVDVTREQLQSVTFAGDAWQTVSAAQLTGRIRTAFGERARQREGAEHRSHFQQGRERGSRDNRQLQPRTAREGNQQPERRPNQPSEERRQNPSEEGRQPPQQTRPVNPAPSPQPERRPPTNPGQNQPERRPPQDHDQNRPPQG